MEKKLLPIGDSGQARIGNYWEGRLEEWLILMAGYDPDIQNDNNFQDWSFPTDEMLENYIGSLDERSEEQVQHLLRCFLFDQSTFGADRGVLEWITLDQNAPQFQRLMQTEYGRRLTRLRKGEKAHPGLRWVLDLLPNSPRSALAVVEAYLVAFGAFLPDGRISGLSDASSIISGRYLRRRGDDGRQALQGISPRELEKLAARLYTAMGYVCELTPASGDGGRDVIAVRDAAGQRERRLIDCKHYSGSLHIREARAIIGTVSTEHATGGVLLTTGRMTRGMRMMADNDSRLDLVDGDRLLELLDEHLGPRWVESLDYWLQWPPRG